MPAFKEANGYAAFFAKALGDIAALGNNAILAGFQGQRAWPDHFPNAAYTA